MSERIVKGYCIIQKLVLLRGSKFILVLIDQFHGNAHEGFGKTLYRLKQDFYWPQMEVDIKKFIRECHVCQEKKVTTISPAGLLFPLHIPTEV